MTCGWIPGRWLKDFFFLANVILPLGPTHYSREMFPRGNGAWGWGMKLTPHLLLVMKLRMKEAIPLFPCMPSWLVQGRVYVYYSWS
jgi:hypothetical protein